ncbi:MAG TPA: YraN family protein [Pyrinomonadaceae bacterium]|nr:YraN family protein [Pyrinomonadaceae bacterium]
MFPDKHFTPEASSLLGARGERLARAFLLKQNYRVACANFKAPVGRNRRGALVTGEIDLIAYDESFLCFIEVKTRSSGEFAAPLAAVDLRKQRQIIRAARMYRRIFHLQSAKIRYDVVSIILRKDAGEKPEIELFKNYFGERKFEKKSWLED